MKRKAAKERMSRKDAEAIIESLQTQVQDLQAVIRAQETGDMDTVFQIVQKVGEKEYQARLRLFQKSIAKLHAMIDVAKTEISECRQKANVLNSQNVLLRQIIEKQENTKSPATFADATGQKIESEFGKHARDKVSFAYIG